MEPHPLIETNPFALEQALSKAEQRITDLWANSPTLGCNFDFDTWERRHLIPVFEVFRDITAQSLFLLLTYPGFQSKSMHQKIQETLHKLVNDLVWWASSQPEFPTLVHSENIRNFWKSHSKRTDVFTRFNKQVKQVAHTWVFELDGHDLSLLEVNTLLQHVPGEDKGVLWRQLRPQLEAFGASIVEHFNHIFDSHIVDPECADPLAERYRLAPRLTERLRSALSEVNRYNRRLTCDVGSANFGDLSITTPRQAQEWMRLVYSRYLPAFEPFLENYLTRSHCTFGGEAIEWPLNISFGRPLQHWLIVPGTNPLDRLFDYAHHLGHGLHQDLVGGDGVYLGAIPDNLNEILPLLNEMLLREILLDSIFLNTTTKETLKQYCAIRWERGIWQEWDIDRFQQNAIRSTVSGCLGPAEMGRLWNEPYSDTSDVGSQRLRSWPLECERMFHHPAVSSNALGGLTAFMILPSLLLQPEAGSSILQKQLERGIDVELEEVLASF